MVAKIGEGLHPLLAPGWHRHTGLDQRRPGSYEIEEAPGQRAAARSWSSSRTTAPNSPRQHRIKEILESYSSFVPFPINLNGENGQHGPGLWLRKQGRDQGRGVHRVLQVPGHAFDEPRYRLHFSADAPLAINALLFVPEGEYRAFGFGRMEPGVSLYCRKVLIDDKPKDLLPEWLRFLKGVVDSEDLPLNISRESMQDSALIEKLNKVITKRFLKFLEEEAKNRRRRLPRVLRSSSASSSRRAPPPTSPTRTALAKLLRFESSSPKRASSRAWPTTSRA
jgi:TNF receptor-associated protein 1